MPRRGNHPIASLLVIGAILASVGGAFAGEVRAEDSSSVGLLALMVGVLHGENLLLLLKALAPEAKILLTAIGACIVGLVALFRRR